MALSAAWPAEDHRGEEKGRKGVALEGGGLLLRHFLKQWQLLPKQRYTDSMFEGALSVEPLLALLSLPNTASMATCQGSVLLGLGSVVLPFARVPQQQGDADGRESHDPKGCPIQLLGKRRKGEGIKH